MPKDHDLSDNRKAFIREYLVDLNCTQAAIRAGYSEKSAGQIGHNLLKIVEIQNAITEAQKEISIRTNVTVDKIVKEYARIAFADIRDIVTVYNGGVAIIDSDEMTDDQAATISEVVQTIQGIRVKQHSKTAALDSLGKHLGMFTEKLSVDMNGPPPIFNLVPVTQKSINVESDDQDD